MQFTSVSLNISDVMVTALKYHRCKQFIHANYMCVGRIIEEVDGVISATILDQARLWQGTESSW